MCATPHTTLLLNAIGDFLYTWNRNFRLNGPYSISKKRQCTTERTVRPFSNIVQPTAEARAMVYRIANFTPHKINSNSAWYNYFYHDQEHIATVYSGSVRELYFIIAALITMAATDDNMTDYMELNTNIALNDRAASICQMHEVRTGFS